MPANARLKACAACAHSKRRCDRKLPECTRCQDQGEHCTYSQRKKRRKNHPALEHGQPAVVHLTGADATGTGLDLGWAAMAPTDVDMALSDWVIPNLQTPSHSIGDLADPGVEVSGGDGGLIAPPWFLRDDTWVTYQSDQITACVVTLDLQPLIDAVEGMLQCWVETGCCSFIHARLYEHGMPTCLQDAFTMLAAYRSATPAMKSTVLQIAEDRAAALVQHIEPTVGGMQGLLAQLSRVHSHFVYEFMRLFDGSVRFRVSAEKQIGVLRRWVSQMWEMARRYRGEDGFLNHRRLPWDTSDFDREYYTASDTWRLWILTESVRRTHLVVNSVANTYRCMTEGFVACDGAAMLTARRGLWDAKSATEWFDIAEAKAPLLVPMLQPGAWMSQYEAHDVDDFVQMYWRHVVGQDRVQSWIEKGRRLVSGGTVRDMTL